MKCPECDNLLSELTDNNGDTFLCCMKCGLVMSSYDSDYRIEFYDADDIEASMLYDKDNIKLKEIITGECMENYVHKCLRCNSYGFEVSEGNFECMKCGFEWEVFTVE